MSVSCFQTLCTRVLHFGLISKVSFGGRGERGGQDPTSAPKKTHFEYWLAFPSDLGVLSSLKTFGGDTHTHSLSERWLRFWRGVFSD